jgi:beta-galactosidase
LLDQDNKNTRRLAEAKTVGREIRKLAADFFDAAPMKIAAILRDFDNETNERRINTYARSGEAEFARWLRGLALRHVPADYVWPDSGFDAYRTLILPHQKIITRELAHKLEKYVAAGGILVLGAQAGLKDVNCHIVARTPPGLLAKLAGVEVEDWTTLSSKETRTARIINGQPITMSTFVERLRPAAAASVARWLAGDSLLSDSPAITVNKFGRGKVYYIAGYCPAPAIDLLIEHLIASADLTVPLSAPPEVEIIHRVAGKTRYVIALNHSSNPQRISGLPAGKELLTGRAVNGDMILSGFDVAVVRMHHRRQT